MAKRTPILAGALLVALLYLAYENLDSASSARPSSTGTRSAAVPIGSAVGGAATLQQQQQNSPPPPQPAILEVASSPPPPPCTSLNCAGRFTKQEPPWADLTFQPNINWEKGGVRGDCVAGELEYIMPKYCSPRPPRARNWPSEERLNSIDVHSAGKPQANLKDVVEMLPNRTILLMGDSVMEQFYNTLQCFLRREDIELPNDAQFLSWVQSTAPLWRMGKRKKPPKLPQRARGNTRLLYARVTTYQPDEVLAAVGTADVIILNWGLHYQRMPDYRTDLEAALTVLNKVAGQPGKAVLFSETGAQHFKASDARGYTTGEWENRDKGADKFCTCKPIEDFNVNVRNRVLREALATGKFPHIRTLPFYELTRPRWRWHFGNCTQRPNGWNYYTCCDCTHFCFSPAMWHAHLWSLKSELQQATGIRSWQKPDWRMFH